MASLNERNRLSPSPEDHAEDHVLATHQHSDVPRAVSNEPITPPTSPLRSLSNRIRRLDVATGDPQQSDTTGEFQSSDSLGSEDEGIERGNKRKEPHSLLQSSQDEAASNNASPALQLSDFEVGDTLGTGHFGKVFLVRPCRASTRFEPAKYFAMKILRKSEVIRLRQVEHVNSERDILSRVHHPFIVGLHGTFQDEVNLYMLLSYVPGGELFALLRQAGRFPPPVAMFYLGNVILALKYLHSLNIVYRDLKPENLLLDAHGYVQLTDFGFAKVVDDRTWTICGTAAYLAPEIIQSSGHGKAVDWWACGILCYEMLVGYPPFFDDNTYDVYEKILKGDISWPKWLTTQSRELISALLHPDKTKRLGNLIGGPNDVLEHPWFSVVPWDTLERRELTAPLIPKVASDESRQFSAFHLTSNTNLQDFVLGDALPFNPAEYSPTAGQFPDF